MSERERERDVSEVDVRYNKYQVEGSTDEDREE